jgi:chromosome partitioning protein
MRLLQPAEDPPVRQTVSLNGQTLAVHGHVLLIDLDPQGNCATALGVRPDGADVADLLTGKQAITDSVISVDRSEDGLPRPNLWLLPASNRLADAKNELLIADFVKMMNNRGGRQGVPLLDVLHERLQVAIERFAYIIIDCPPTIDALSNAIYQFAQAAIVPVKVDYLSAAGTAQHVGDIRNAQMEGIEIAIHTILPTFYVKRQVLDQQIVEALQKTYGARRVAEPIPKNQVVAEAPAYLGGATIFEYAPDSPAAEAYWQLVERVFHG